MSELISPASLDDEPAPESQQPGPGGGWFIATGGLTAVLAPLILMRPDREAAGAVSGTWGPAVVLLCVIAAAFRVRRSGLRRPPDRGMSFVLCTVLLALAVGAILFRRGGMPVLLAAGPVVALALGGWRAGLAVVPAWIWLLVAGPFVGQAYDQWLEAPSRPWDGRTADWASVLLERDELRHRVDDRSGPVDADFVVQTRHGETRVPQEFDGALSPVLLVTLTGLCAAGLGRGIFRILVLVVSAGFWAVAAEAVRLALLTSLAERQGIAADGQLNVLVTLVLFLAAFGLVFSLDCGLSFLFPFGGAVMFERVRTWFALREAEALAKSLPDLSAGQSADDQVADGDVAGGETLRKRSDDKGQARVDLPGKIDLRWKKSEARLVSEIEPKQMSREKESTVVAAIDPTLVRRTQRGRVAFLVLATVVVAVVWLIPPLRLEALRSSRGKLRSSSAIASQAWSFEADGPGIAEAGSDVERVEQVERFQARRGEERRGKKERGEAGEKP